MKDKIDETQVKTINVKLPEGLHQRFKIIVTKESLDMQKKALHLIAEYVGKKELEYQRQEDDDENF